MLILDNAKSWPRQLTRRLNQDHVIGILRRHAYIEELIHDPTIRPILAEVEECAATTYLAAYHCTKQLRDRPYSTTGLRLLNFENHYGNFRDLLRSHPAIGPELFLKIDKRLRDWRTANAGERENKLWLCIDRPLVLDPGAESFFKYFGGEAIYFPFIDDSEVAPFLEQLGEPVVVEARIMSKDLNVIRQFALGRTLVSYFAKSVNPEFRTEGLEGYLKKPVPPGDIVAVYPKKEFVKAIRPKGRDH